MISEQQHLCCLAAETSKIRTRAVRVGDSSEAVWAERLVAQLPGATGEARTLQHAGFGRCTCRCARAADLEDLVGQCSALCGEAVPVDVSAASTGAYVATQCSMLGLKAVSVNVPAAMHAAVFGSGVCERASCNRLCTRDQATSVEDNISIQCQEAVPVNVPAAVTWRRLFWLPLFLAGWLHIAYAQKP